MMVFTEVQIRATLRMRLHVAVERRLWSSLLQFRH